MISNLQTAYRHTASNASSYEANCGSQRRTILDSTAVIEKATNIAASTMSGRDFSLADFGASTGGNSIVVSDQVARNVLQRNPAARLNVTRSDSRYNDFAELSKNVLASKGQTWRRAINERILCGSFYKQMMPTNSLDMAVSTSCLHWLSAAQRPRMQRTLASASVEPAALADSDLNAFFTARAAELRSGGSLFATMVGAMERGAEADHRPLTLLHRAIETLKREGLLSSSASLGALVPIHLRTLQDVSATLSGRSAPLSHQYKVHLIEQILIECPIYHAYLQHREAERYAREYRGFVQGFSFGSVRRSISLYRGKRSNGFSSEQLTELLFESFEQHAAAEARFSPAPTAHIRVVLERA